VFSVAQNDHLIRSNIWSPKLKEILEDELMGWRYVDMISDFPDGETLNIPSIGQAQVHNFAEGQKAIYNGMDTGNFTFSITEYLQSGMYITEKMKQDSFYTGRLVSSFIPKMHRALAKRIEMDILSIGPLGQTVANANTIFGADHRWVGSGTNETIDVTDFAKARYSLKKANVPDQNLIAIVDPTVEYKLNTLTNLVNMSYNPMWEGIVTSGIATGLKFIRNIYGFDVYVSNNLHVNTATETIGSKSTAIGAVNNLFFSASQDVLPFVGAIRQAPKVDSEYNKDEQREEYVVTCRYGTGFYRPENFVNVITDTDQVTF
jgi:hypothetical protein